MIDTAYRHFAALSCLAVILALGFDPFTQNLIHYQQKMTADTSRIALVGNISTVDSHGFFGSSGSRFNPQYSAGRTDDMTSFMGRSRA